MKKVKLWEGNKFYILAYTMYTACTFADQDWLKDYLRLDLLIPLMGILEMDFPRFGDQTTTSPFLKKLFTSLMNGIGMSYLPINDLGQGFFCITGIMVRFWSKADEDEVV